MNEKKIFVKKGNKKKPLLVLAMAGVLGCGGILGASAFFTDHETTQATATVGTFNMQVTDMSDLDGQYSSWSADGVQTKVLTAAGAQADDVRGAETVVDADHKKYANAKDFDNPSTGIINPGDTGIYQYKIANIAEKSMDTAKTVKVTLTLAADAKMPTSATDPTLIDAKFDKATDADAYTIDGLGTPVAVVSEDGKTMTLSYAQADTEVLSGSKEADGAANNVIYAYNADFNRLCGNKYQGLGVKIDTTVYAKQHRNGINSTLTVKNDGSIAGTGDWAEIANFETVANA